MFSNKASQHAASVSRALLHSCSFPRRPATVP